MAFECPPLMNAGSLFCRLLQELISDAAFLDEQEIPASKSTVVVLPPMASEQRDLVVPPHHRPTLHQLRTNESLLPRTIPEISFSFRLKGGMASVTLYRDHIVVQARLGKSEPLKREMNDRGEIYLVDSNGYTVSFRHFPSEVRDELIKGLRREQQRMQLSNALPEHLVAMQKAIDTIAF